MEICLNSNNNALHILKLSCFQQRLRLSKFRFKVCLACWTPPWLWIQENMEARHSLIILDIIMLPSLELLERRWMWVWMSKMDKLLNIGHFRITLNTIQPGQVTCVTTFTNIPSVRKSLTLILNLNCRRRYILTNNFF